ncbi:MAG TPA: GNAT family N-acetyltransferase [Acidimicrobiia bacterium]|nr:GNAT family N-acetyltransferase [Acidimicrobiia bacterium]
MIEVRTAGPADLPEIIRMYRRLEREMVDLHEMWPLADGIDEPIDLSIGARIESGEWFVYVATIDSVPLGFLFAHLRSLLEQAQGERVGVIDLLFTEPEAREVGIAEALLDVALADLARAGAERFDAPVLPGHRLAKNFFERAGFSARSITMHRRKR